MKKYVLFAFIVFYLVSSLSAWAQRRMNSSIPTDGLVAYYPFNGNANDESGNGNHGTPTANVKLAEGVAGDANGSYQFGGYDNPGHIYVPNSESLQFSNGATFSCYIKPTSWTSMDGWGSRVSSGGVQCLIAKEHDRRGVTFEIEGNDERMHVWMGSMDNQSWAEAEDRGCFRRRGNAQVFNP